MKNIRRLFTKLRTKMSRKTTIFVSSVALLVALVSGIAYAGYGPNRPVFDWNNTADRVGSLNGPVLNSFINTPVYGDERAFVDGKDSSVTQPGGFQDQIPVQAGNEYLIRMYVHNNANQTTNDAAHNYIGVAKDTKVRFKILPGMANGNEITGYISADNAIDRNGNPLRQVYDTVNLKNDKSAFELQYVKGSAKIENQAHPSGLALSDDIVSDNGVQIGFNQMDGNLPGCFEFSAYVTIRVKVVQPVLSVQKQVRRPGETTWHDSLEVKPGETVQWLVKVLNTGPTVQHNMVANDLLPPHLTYVDGSAKWYSASQNGVPYNFSQFVINNGKGGYDFGDYAANGGGFLVRFDTAVNGDFNECSIAIRNIANARSDEINQDQQTHADLRITKQNCQPTPTPTPTPTPSPTPLPNTGAGDIIGIFTATSATSAAAYHIVRRRKR